MAIGIICGGRHPGRGLVIVVTAAVRATQAEPAAGRCAALRRRDGQRRQLVGRGGGGLSAAAGGRPRGQHVVRSVRPAAAARRAAAGPPAGAAGADAAEAADTGQLSSRQGRNRIRQPGSARRDVHVVPAGARTTRLWAYVRTLERTPWLNS